MDLRRNDRIGGQHEAHALAACLADDPFGVVELVRLHQALPELEAACGKEGVGHAATDEDRLAPRQERLEHLELAGDLGAADDRVERARRLLQAARDSASTSRSMSRPATAGR